MATRNGIRAGATRHQISSRRRIEENARCATRPKTTARAARRALGIAIPKLLRKWPLLLVAAEVQIISQEL